ncbi:MAG: Flp pilus assembly complex ATPase component TadA [Vallitaleaceae bacterium]|nr:Flp pilus assembly complex ATPase component TadA [Vallitaleaceae bacterium]
MLDPLNFFLIALVFLAAALFVTFILIKQFQTVKKVEDKKRLEHLEIPYLLSEVKEMLLQLTSNRMDEFSGSKESYERELNKRALLRKALKNCNVGSLEDKRYIVELIADLLEKYLIQRDEADQVLFFSKPKFLSAKDMFDILIYRYQKEYEQLALEKLITEEGWDQLQKTEYESLDTYTVTEAQVRKAYYQRIGILEEREKIEIIAQRIYELYKGFGAVDCIRDMSIDGVSGGVSGLIDSDGGMDAKLLSEMKYIPHNYDSIWIFYKGKSIHLSFLSFESEKELRRVCQNIYRYNKAGQLSEDIGYKVNEMKDGSRVVVVRPPFSESWAFFVRKFHIQKLELEELIQGENCCFSIQLMKFLMKGGAITSVTGSQGSGKTTMLMALIKHIHPTLTLRVQEMAFELNLRKIYPYRNILTFKETSAISGQAGLDLQKKTDGCVNILGEVATDEVSVLMLQMAQVASLFTLFTHHAKTVDDLILSLRNSLLKCNVFRDERIAEEQVIHVLDFDIHLNKNLEGKRYIERITEITKKENSETGKGKIILEYENGAYYPREEISKEKRVKLAKFMGEGERKEFYHFIAEYWGGVEDEFLATCS